MFAAWRIDDFAGPAPFGEQRLRIVRMADEREHAAVVRAPVADAAQLLDEIRVVRRVALVAARALRVAC